MLFVEIQCPSMTIPPRASESSTSDVHVVHTNIIYTCTDRLVFQTGLPTLSVTCGIYGHWRINNLININTMDYPDDAGYLLAGCSGNHVLPTILLTVEVTFNVLIIHVSFFFSFQLSSSGRS